MLSGRLGDDNTSCIWSELDYAVAARQQQEKSYYKSQGSPRGVDKVVVVLTMAVCRTMRGIGV